MKKLNIVKLLIAVFIPLAVGGLSAFLTKDAMMVFDTIKKPPLAPPGIVFPMIPYLVWMTFAGYLNLMIFILN